MPVRETLCALALVAAGLAAPGALAEPVAIGAPHTPVVLRRTALIVQDIEASLKFYRDGLGLIVVDDRTKRIPESALSDADATRVTRLVLLRANDDYAGQLELITFAKPARTPPPATGEPRHLGGLAILFTAQDVAATFRKVKAIPGVQVSEEPRLKTYQAYGRPGTTTDIFCSVFDPDGNFIEINEPTTKKP